MPHKTREEKAAYMRSYYQRNRAKWRRQHAERARERRVYLAELKAARGCSQCSEDDPRVLQFHHRDESEKEFTIGAAVNYRSLEALLREVEKCDVLCANCHIKTHVSPYGES